MTPIPQQIRYARLITAGLTQQQLADRLSITQQLISEYENGTRTPSATRFQEIIAKCAASRTKKRKRNAARAP